MGLGQLPTQATRQFALLVRAEVVPERLAELRAVLATIAAQTNAYMRGEDGAERLVPFDAVTTIHYARLVLIDDDRDPATPPAAPLLVLSTNYDGPVGKPSVNEREARRLHIDELVREAGDGLDKVFAHCRGYTGKAALRRFMAKRHVAAQTFYVGSSGRSRDQILGEKELHDRVQTMLNEDLLRTPEGQRMSPDQLRDAVIAQLDAAGQSVPPFGPQPDLSAKADKLWTRVKRVLLVVYGAVVAAAVLLPSPWAWLARGLLALMVVLPAIGVYLFRYKEKHDVPFEPAETVERHDRQRWASVDENLYHQNQLTHMVQVKPGFIRALVIRGVFVYLQNAATYVFNKGKLGDIPSIHMARWAFIGGRRVLFMSNFDASWQSYLGDFIDKASSGLTAVWSNTEGYPRTRWLTAAGSRDAARFLAWTRYHQLPTAVWYGAYPSLSVVNINDNTQIRRGLGDPDAMDAATWLHYLRSVDKTAADKLAGQDAIREPSLALHNIQGIVLRGYGHKPEARFVMYRVRANTDVAALRTWLSALPLTPAALAPRVVDAREPFVNIAFSHRGMAALQLDQSLLNRFPLAFVQGSHDDYRRRINGDIGDNDSTHWEWGADDSQVDLVLLVYADDADQVETMVATLHGEASAWLERVVDPLEGRRLAGRKEHFGFRDGIAQPIVVGSGRPEVHNNTVAAGEFLLGHRDGYGNVFHGPTSANGFNFGLDGSYLVFRQLAQDVEGFWSFCARQTEIADPVTVASKMVGRWPSGAPLVRHPDADPEQPRFQDEDDFGYLENNQHNDRYGARCPFGSHLRRSNPRDWEVGETREESLRLSHLHRIIRRGRPYGDPLDAELRPAAMIERAAAGAAPARRGLHFLAFNANIERQFEFVQQQWCGNSKFAGLQSGAGPLLGPFAGAERGEVPGTFTTQTDVDVHTLPQATDMERFVRVRGSSYFFMPSITAVRMLAGPVVHGATPTPDLEVIPQNEQVHIDNLIQNLRAKMNRDYDAGKTLRDAHPKMHGCVEASFEIPDDLDDDLRVGIFGKPGSHKAWVRLSNADGKVQDDGDKDIRGFAIKLLDVDGAKLIDGEETCTTHDFLFVSHPTFIVSDVAEFDALVAALFGSGWQKLAFFASHLGVLMNIRRAFKTIGDLLSCSYFSAVPYLFGDRAAKYRLTPIAPIPTSSRAAGEPDYLRKRLVDQLSASSARFELSIQFQRDPGSEPVEDPTVQWRTPFTKLATITLPQQTFDTRERRRFGEDLSFNPWRCLAEHRPLGGINRARRQVYTTLSKFRHERNLVPRQEPGDAPSGWPPTEPPV